jgi:hypothetical protein
LDRRKERFKKTRRQTLEQHEGWPRNSRISSPALTIFPQDLRIGGTFCDVFRHICRELSAFRRIMGR